MLYDQRSQIAGYKFVPVDLVFLKIHFKNKFYTFLKSEAALLHQTLF